MESLALFCLAVVAGVGYRLTANNPSALRRAAALLVRRAAAIEAANRAAAREGRAAYEAACQHMGIECEENRHGCALEPMETKAGD